MVLATRKIERKRGKLTAPRHCFERSLGDPTQLNRPLGDEVHPVSRFVVDLVEQLMKLEEGWSLDVPVSLLRLQLEVDSVREVRVEELDDFRTSVLGEVVPGWVFS